MTLKLLKKPLLLLAALPLLLGCPKDETVKFGAVLPLSGEASIYGQPIQNGVQLALEQLQADKAYPYAVVLEVLDSESNPDVAAANLEQLYKDGTLAAIGGVTTAEALKMVPVADKYSNVLVSPSASTPELTGISKNFYRLFPSDAREGATMGNFATQKLKAERVVILAKEDAYAKGVQQVFKSEFERYGGEVLDLIEFPSLDTDLSGLAERIMTLEPDAVYVAAYAGDIAQMVKFLRDSGYKGTFFTTSAFASPGIIAEVGEPAEGIFLTQAVFDPESEVPLIRDFVQAYQTKYGALPDLYAAHGYDAMMVLAETLRNSGPIESEFWRGVRGLRDVEGVTGMVQFDERGDVQKFPRVYVVINGALVDYEAEVQERRKRLMERLRKLEEEQKRRAQGEEGGG